MPDFHDFSPPSASHNGAAPSLAPPSRLVLHTPPPKGWLGKVLLGLGLLLAAGALVGVAVVAFFYIRYADGLPELPTVEDYRPPIVTELWSDDHVLAGELYDERRKVVPYERIPKKLVQAFIAAEDERFFDHPGFDPIGTARAAYKTYVLGSRVQGGSSLTQQAAKAVLISVELSRITEQQVRDEVRRRLEPRGLADDPDAVRAEALQVHADLRRKAHARATEKTLRRKFRELILALRLERAMTKEQILYLYLNNVYLGHHSYGVQAAAENYFRKDVRDLTLGEIAYLAGLPQAPSAYSPWARPERAKKRRSYVLRRMAEEGMITEADRVMAEAENPTIYPVEDVFRAFAPFFSEQVRRDLVARYGNERLLRDGLQVYLAMDAEKQRAAQVAMLDGLMRVDKRQGYYGPLGHLKNEAERAAFEKKIASRLGEETLTEGRFYVGYVERIDNEGNFAVVNVGGRRGTLPILGMRWARPPNPEEYYPNALIDHVKRALKVGDIVVVKAVARKELLEDAEPRFVKLLPKQGPYLTLEQEPRLQGAIVSIDPARQYYVAMIGGYDFDASEFNRAFQACRQPGSAFKPVIYSAAVELLGWQVNQVLVDAPIVFDDPANQNRWKPENYGSDFKGDVLLRTALINSMNIPAVKTLDAVGVGPAMEWAQKLGISTKINPDLSMALGGSCVQPAELVTVFSEFNQGGVRVRPTFLRRVEDRFGRMLEDHTAFDDEFATFEQRVAAGYDKLLTVPERVMKPETASILTHLMREVVLFGTGAPAQRLGKPAAGKTGTTNDSFDTWFVGFTQSLVAGVWLGYDRYEQPLGRYETGGRASLPIWVQYMKQALGDRPEKEFNPVPGSNISWVRIDADTGLRASAASSRSVVAPFVAGFEPTESAPEPGEVDPKHFMYGLP